MEYLVISCLCNEILKVAVGVPSYRGVACLYGFTPYMGKCQEGNPHPPEAIPDISRGTLCISTGIHVTLDTNVLLVDGLSAYPRGFML